MLVIPNHAEQIFVQKRKNFALCQLTEHRIGNCPGWQVGYTVCQQARCPPLEMSQAMTITTVPDCVYVCWSVCHYDAAQPTSYQIWPQCTLMHDTPCRSLMCQSFRPNHICGVLMWCHNAHLLTHIMLHVDLHCTKGSSINRMPTHYNGSENTPALFSQLFSGCVVLGFLHHLQVLFKYIELWLKIGVFFGARH